MTREEVKKYFEAHSTTYSLGLDVSFVKQVLEDLVGSLPNTTDKYLWTLVCDQAWDKHEPESKRRYK